MPISAPFGASAAPREQTARAAAQVLVIDASEGPASVVAGVLKRLMPGAIDVQACSDYAAARALLARRDFDLVLLGLEEARRELYSLLATLYIERPDLDVVVVARGLSRPWLVRARYSGARKVVRLPGRVDELKALIRYLAREFLAS